VDHDVAGIHVSHEFKTRQCHVAKINMKCAQETVKLLLEINRRAY